jgi:hypothetical protein
MAAPLLLLLADVEYVDVPSLSSIIATAVQYLSQ